MIRNFKNTYFCIHKIQVIVAYCYWWFCVFSFGGRWPRCYRWRWGPGWASTPPDSQYGSSEVRACCCWAPGCLGGGCWSIDTGCSSGQWEWFSCTSCSWITISLWEYVYLFVGLDEVIEVAGVFLVVVPNKLVESDQLRPVQLLQSTYLTQYILNNSFAQRDITL